MFISFLFDQTGRLWPEALLNPEPLNPEPLNPEPLNPEPLNPEPLNPEPLNLQTFILTGLRPIKNLLI
jgi:hypothetical protein